MPADVASASQLTSKDKAGKKDKSSKKRKEQADPSAAAATPPAVKAKKIKSSNATPVAAAPAVAASPTVAAPPSAPASASASNEAASKPAKLKKKKSSSDLDHILAGVDPPSKPAKKQKRKSDAAAAAAVTTPSTSKPATPAPVASSSATPAKVASTSAAPAAAPAPAPAAPSVAAATPVESSKAEKKKKKKEKNKDKAAKPAEAAPAAAKAAAEVSPPAFYPALPPPPPNAVAAPVAASAAPAPAASTSAVAAPAPSAAGEPSKGTDKAARAAQKARDKAEKKARKKEHKERRLALEQAAAAAKIQSDAGDKAAKKKSKKDKKAAVAAAPAEKAAADAPVEKPAAPATPATAPAAPQASPPASPAAPSSSAPAKSKTTPGNPFLQARTRTPSVAPGGFDPSQYPRGFDFAAMADYLVENPGSTSGGAAQGDAAAAAAAAASSAGDGDESPEALLAKINAVISAPGYVAPKSRLSLPARRPMPTDGPRVRARVSKGDRAPTKGAKSKAETVADARGLTHTEMLATKLYQPTQLKWLEEEYDLTWKKGKYDKTDDATIDKAIKTFAANNEMDEEDVRTMIVARDPSQADLYADLFVEIATALGDRPNRSVRKHVVDREERSGKGAWNSDEEAALDAAVALYQKDWKKISEEVGRPAANCRSHFNLTRTVPSNKGAWKDDEVKALNAAVQHITKGNDVPSKDVPWQAVAERMGTRSALQCNKKWTELQRTAPKLSWIAARDDVELIKRIKADEAVMKRNDDSTIEFAKMYDEDTFPYSGKKLHDRWARLKKSLLKDEDVEKLKLKKMLKIMEPVVQEKHAAWVAGGSKVTKESKLDLARLEDTIDSDAEMETFSQPATPARPKPTPRAAAAAAKGKQKEVAEPEEGDEEEDDESDESDSDDSLGSSD